MIKLNYEILMKRKKEKQITIKKKKKIAKKIRFLKKNKTKMKINIFFKMVYFLIQNYSKRKKY